MVFYRTLTTLITCILLFQVQVNACECNNTIDNRGIPLTEMETYFSSFDLQNHDNSFKGHAVEKHVGKTKDWLEGRLSGSRHQKLASSYIDMDTANHVIKTIVSENQSKIKKWLEQDDGKEKLTLMKTFKSKVGIMMKRGNKNPEDCNVGIVILKRTHRNSQRFFIVTSYPVAKTTETLEEKPYHNPKNHNLKQVSW